MSTTNIQLNEQAFLAVVAICVAFSFFMWMLYHIIMGLANKQFVEDRAQRAEDRRNESSATVDEDEELGGGGVEVAREYAGQAAHALAENIDKGMRLEHAERTVEEARAYLGALLKSYPPAVEPAEDLPGVCTQIDNLLMRLRRPHTGEGTSDVVLISTIHRQLNDCFAKLYPGVEPSPNVLGVLQSVLHSIELRVTGRDPAPKPDSAGQ